MKTKMLFMAMMVILCLTACSKDETGVYDPSGFDNNQELPMFEYDKTKDFVFWPTPTIDDSELTGGGYDFAYWQQHNTEAAYGNWSIEEMMSWCNIPKDLLDAMSTRNLAITCFNYPYNPLFSAYNNQYKGFLGTIEYFNGYAVLMKRYGGLQATLDLYAELEQYGKTFGYFQAWTFFVCSAVDHKVLSSEQVARLAQVVTSRFYDGTKDTNLAFTYLLGAFIAYHYDTTLPDEQLYLLKVYIHSSCQLTPVDKPVDRISTIIESSLNRLGSVD